MATSMQVEAEPSVEQAIQQISNIQVEGEEEEDPLEGLNNKEIAEIYKKLTLEDRQLFRQFKKFHKLYYELYDHDARNHQLTHGIINKMFSGIPAKDEEVIAVARAEISRAYANSWDWPSQLSYSSARRLRHQSIHHLLCHHGSPCIKKNRSDWCRAPHNRSHLKQPRTSSLMLNP